MGPLGWLGLIVLGIALHWTINLTFTNNPTFRFTNSQFGQNSGPQYMVYAAAWLLIIMGVLWPVVTVTFGWGIVTLFVFGMIVHQYRRQETQSLLWLLGLAMEKGIPANKMARAFARERCDEVGCRANRLAELIEQGMPLDNALRESRYRLPADAQLAITMNAATQATGKLIHDTARRQAQVDLEVHPYFHQLFYLTTVTVAGICILAFVAIKCLPVFVQILQDFALPTNTPTASTVVFVNGLASYAWLSFWICALVGVFVIIQILHYLGWITWEPLFIRRITRRYHASVILRTLASQVASAIPIHTSLESMSTKYPRHHIRRRLHAAAAGVRLGRPWQECLHAEKLISPSDANVLQSAEKVGNLPWALEEIANGIIRRLRYRLLMWMRILIPLLLVSLAIVVGLFGAAIFTSLRDIVLSVTP